MNHAASHHRARGDRRAGIRERELEHPIGEQWHACRQVKRVGDAFQEEPVRPDEGRAVHEHDEAPRPEGHAADAGVDDAFDEDVDRLARPREAPPRA